MHLGVSILWSDAVQRGSFLHILHATEIKIANVYLWCKDMNPNYIYAQSNYIPVVLIGLM